MTARRPKRAATRQPPETIASAVASIRRLVRALRLLAQRTQAAAGVSAAQIFVLEQLGDGDRLSLNELASRTLTDRSSVADVVDRLHDQGYIARETDPTDRRRAAIRITAAGRRLLARSPQAPATALIAAVRRLSTSDRAKLAESLELLNNALGVADIPATLLFNEEGGRRIKKTPP